MPKSVNNERNLNIEAYQFFACEEGCIWRHEGMFCSDGRIVIVECFTG
jgi:hypothetical protein